MHQFIYVLLYCSAVYSTVVRYTNTCEVHTHKHIHPRAQHRGFERVQLARVLCGLAAPPSPSEMSYCLQTWVRLTASWDIEKCTSHHAIQNAYTPKKKRRHRAGVANIICWHYLRLCSHRTSKLPRLSYCYCTDYRQYRSLSKIVAAHPPTNLYTQ